jgi:endonuclease YncB( thermonuclease family)
MVFFIQVPALAADDRYEGRAERVIDGDTVSVMTTGYERIRVRLYGIDAPEKNQSGGQESMRALKDLIENRDIEVVVLDIDRYSRQVGLIYLDGKSINLEMVAQGQAWVYDRYCKDNNVCPGFRKAQSDAQRDHLGLWSDPNAVPPWDHRRGRGKPKS